MSSDAKSILGTTNDEHALCAKYTTKGAQVTQAHRCNISDEQFSHDVILQMYMNSFHMM